MTVLLLKRRTAAGFGEPGSPLPSLSRGRNKLFLDTAQCFLSQETLPYVQEVLPDPKASNVALVLSAPPAAGWQRMGNSPGTGWRAWWGVLGTALSEPAGAPPPLGAPSPLLLPSPVSEPFSALAVWGNASFGTVVVSRHRFGGRNDSGCRTFPR